VIAASIEASGADINNGTKFTIAEYVIPGTTQAEVTSQGSKLTVKFTNGGNGQERLELVFATGLATTGSTALDTNSSLEHQNGAGNRFLVTGMVTAQGGNEPPVAAVPEPSTLAVVAICAPAFLVYARRRRKGTDVA